MRQSGYGLTAALNLLADNPDLPINRIRSNLLANNPRSANKWDSELARNRTNGCA